MVFNYHELGLLMRYYGLSLLIVTCANLLAAATHAQEPRALVRQKEWQAAGVCVGERQCGFCSTSDTLTAGPSLRVTNDSEVSVVMQAGSTRTAALEIGGRKFVLTSDGSDSFVAGRASGSKIVRAMQHEKSLTIYFTDDRARTRYRYSLTEFPRAYRAMIHSCPKVHP